MEDDGNELLRLVADREQILNHLTGDRCHKPEIVDATGVSRSTIDRAIRELEPNGLVERTSAGFTASVKGRLVLEQYRSAVSTSAGLAALDDALKPLPPTVDIELPAITGATVSSVPESDLSPSERLHEVIESFDNGSTVFTLFPAETNSGVFNVIGRRVMESRFAIESVLDDSLFDSVRVNGTGELKQAVTTKRWSVLTGDVPEYGLLIGETDRTTTVVLLVFSHDQTLHTVVRNQRTDAVQWAKETYGRYQENACQTDRTVDSVQPTSADTGLDPDSASFNDDRSDQPSSSIDESVTGDGEAESTETATIEDQTRSHQPSDGHPTSSDAAITTTVRIELENEGFVFENRTTLPARSTLSPLEYWKNGFDLATAYQGYPLRRERPNADGRTDLVERILDVIRNEGVCSVVGPPGSGKSTTVKQAAAEWLDRHDGTVVYRQSDHPTAFESAAYLKTLLRNADSPRLVVVEDSVRDDADTIFDVAQAFHNDSQVSFLFDARRTEWEKNVSDVVSTPAESHGNDAIETISMPPLDEAEIQRLIDAFVTATGNKPGLTGPQLYEMVRLDRESATSTGDLLFAVHRLLSLCRSNTGDSNPLRVDVESTYQEIRNDHGEETLDLALLFHLLNLTDSELRPELLYAGAFQCVDRRPVKQVNFVERRFVTRKRVPDSVGKLLYDSVHEARSRLFLSAFVAETTEREAARRLGRAVSGVLGLADDERLRKEVRWQVVGAADYIDRIVSDPEGWVTDLVEEVFKVGQRCPLVVSLLSVEDTGQISLPEACGPETRVETLLNRGQLFVTKKYADESARDFRTALETIDEQDLRMPRERVRALLGKSKAHQYSEQYQSARDAADEATARCEAHDFESLEARAQLRSATLSFAFRDYRDTRDILRNHVDETLLLSGDRLYRLRVLALTEGLLNNLQDASKQFKRAFKLCNEQGSKYDRVGLLNNLALAVAWNVLIHSNSALDITCETPQDDWYHPLAEAAPSVDTTGGVPSITTVVQSIVRQCEHLGEEIGFDYAVGGSKVSGGIVAWYDADFDRAEANLRSAADAYAEVSTLRLGLPQRWLAAVLTTRGEYAHAATLIEKSRNRFSDVSDPLIASLPPLAEGDLLYVTASDPDVGRKDVRLEIAADRYREAWDSLRRTDCVAHKLSCLERLVRVESDRGHYEQAARFHEMAEEAALAAGLESKRVEFREVMKETGE